MGAGDDPDRDGASAAAERRRRKPPTVRQVYALAYALCAGAGLRFPRTRAEASELIEKLRLDVGHPRPALEDNPRRGPLRPKFDWRAAAAKSKRR